MPNIGTLLKQEIARLARKETRGQVDPARKAITQHRRDIAALKRQVADLERQLKLVARRAAPPVASAAAAGSPKAYRFVAKGLRSLRKRLALSAAQFGALAGVSAQSVYNWEHESAVPRGAQLAKIAALRGITRRDALQQLQAPRAVAPKRKARKTRKAAKGRGARKAR